MYALVKDVPKALLPIRERPLIDYIIDKIKPLDGLSEIIVVTNDKFYKTFQDWAAAKKDFSFPIRIVNDGTKTPETRLGSIGDMNFILKQGVVKSDLLIVGGDNLFDYNLDAYLKFARSKSPAASIGLYDIKNIEEATKFGVVELDKDSRIVSFEEKPQKPKSTLVAMCFYYLPKASLGLVAEYLSASAKSDTAGDYIRWLSEKKDVYGFKFTGKWYDIGSIESYQEAQEKFR